MKTIQERTRGFSLVELMISMVLGIVIVGGSIAIFSGVVGSSSLNQTISNLQSKARFGLDQMGRDIRAAGFMGCAAERNVSLSVNVDTPPTTDLSSTALTGYVVGTTDWTPGLPLAYTAPTSVGKPVAGTHALGVQYAQFPGFILNASMSSNSSALEFERDDDTAIRANQLMVVSDCNSADLFSIQSVTKATSTITVSSSNALAKVYARSTEYPDKARGMPFISTIYYIGDTQRESDNGDEVYSLYAHSYPYTSANPPIELIEGVDQLVLEFGVRQDDDSLAYVTAGETGYNSETVETVRVGLLLSSLDNFKDVDSSRQYILAGKTVSAFTAVVDDDEDSADTGTDTAAGTDTTGTGSTGTGVALTYISDQRLRMPFNATFNLRNRN